MPSEALAVNLPQLRASRGWSQADLAEHVTKRSGVKWHQTTVARVEHGTRSVSIDEAFCLAALFRLPITDLCRGATGTDPLVRAQQQALANRDAARRALREAEIELASLGLEEE